MGYMIRMAPEVGAWLAKSGTAIPPPPISSMRRWRPCGPAGRVWARRSWSLLTIRR